MARKHKVKDMKQHATASWAQPRRKQSYDPHLHNCACLPSGIDREHDGGMQSLGPFIGYIHTIAWTCSARAVVDPAHKPSATMRCMCPSRDLCARLEYFPFSLPFLCRSFLDSPSSFHSFRVFYCLSFHPASLSFPFFAFLSIPVFLLDVPFPSFPSVAFARERMDVCNDTRRCCTVSIGSCGFTGCVDKLCWRRPMPRTSPTPQSNFNYITGSC
jgi:hypothetical protein